ncbi:hypothetical protein GCM10007421_06570 [Halopseudomonas oceani]|uniref:DUF3299 domain-containing protein n=1 Tax=Halopseudomonas oceani TaxID=1708783 RepID=A0A2P4F0B5_9GAMM|nr:DUF3299 domain-containing protein [Halopseudomonas oceani]POB06428.1 DUF3299 domain-containing protein [Halopseudomonas oceani]GGE35470.1 hypothetical protein GCM10007421_06570 [Halopseudomonas oceani]
MLLRSAILLLALALPVHASEPLTVDWLDLLPAEDYQAMLDMPEIDHGTGLDAEGNFSNSLRQRDNSLPEVMYSTRVVAKYDGKNLRIGGYPVPLETDDNGRYTSFFLVPYAGACIHVPPPPPNQIILVEYPAGIAIDDIYQPYWVQGTLRVEQTSNELADASYQLQAARVWLYDGE